MSSYLDDVRLGENGGRAPRLMIAEDDLASAAVLRTMLQRAGYTAAVYPDGPSVIRALEEEGPPDVLLLDWMLPGISGLEVCHWARQRWDALSLPVLMVTAKTDAESIYAAFDAGASDYVAKPFRGAELRARIEAHLRTQRLMEDRRRFEEHLREREKLSSLGLLASGVAHDLNNPLAAISGCAQLLLRSETDDVRREDLQHILTEVERCRGIVSSVLSYARRQPSRRAEVDLAELLRGTVELRERALRAAGVRAALVLPGDLPPLWADRSQLQQVFLNIILNAEHAFAGRGGALRIEARVHVDPGMEREWVWIEFHNDAPPIPPEVLPRIFEPFFTTKGEEEGTGLGLAVCRGIVQEHAGAIQVESGEAGTLFRIRIPRAPMAALASAG